MTELLPAPPVPVIPKTGIETEKIAFYFWSKNLAGTKYISYGYDFGAVHLGDPAIWGSSLSFKF